MAELTAKAVEDVLVDVLFSDIDEAAFVDAVAVRGIVNQYRFHPERLESHRSEIMDYLLQLPSEFFRSGGGGWSFLNAAVRSDGEQWGEHQDMERLFCLGEGLGLVSCQLPREVWEVLPGGMPYYVINDV